LRWIQHFNIATHVPEEGSISYPDLAAAASVPEPQLKRITRFVMLNGFFLESVPGLVSHSAMSHLLATSPPLQDFVNHAVEFSYPVSVKMAEMTEKYKGSVEKNETAFNVAFDTPLPMFAWLKSEPEHASRFGRLMGAMKSSPTYSVQHLVDGYDWAALGKGKVVDVGGSGGHTSVAVAQKFTGLDFVVQDLEYVVQQSKDNLPADLQSRVEFMPHDFFTAQPVKDADVYLLRQILHDWPDESAIVILKNLVTGLKAGAKILVMDQVVPAPGALPNVQEKAARTVDLVVMSHFNGKQRDFDDWKRIFKAVDERLAIRSVSLHPGSVLSIIELGLDDAPKTNGHAEVVVEDVNAVPAANGHENGVAAKEGDDVVEDVPHTNGHVNGVESLPVEDKGEPVMPDTDEEHVPSAKEVPAVPATESPVITSTDEAVKEVEVPEMVPAEKSKEKGKEVVVSSETIDVAEVTVS
jgi:6-hydroxytryprostatin B O-methyltransferase